MSRPRLFQTILLFVIFADPGVEVIYVCPVEINDEVYQYYTKLLAMKARPLSASGTGGTGDEEDIENRYKIVVPEAVHRFPVSHVRQCCFRNKPCQCFFFLNRGFGKPSTPLERKLQNYSKFNSRVSFFNISRPDQSIKSIFDNIR